MALPGEEACRPVIDCGSGRWGTLPRDASTVHVDAGYGGSDGDGSEAKPFPTIAQAVAAAAPGVLVAVAAGLYPESIAVDKPVRLWGVCPDQVTVEGTGAAPGCPSATACIVEGADGTEIGGLALTGAGAGIALSGVVDVVVDRVRVHANLGRGVNIENTLGVTTVDVRGSLIEGNQDFGLLAMGSVVTVEGSTIRRTQPRPADGTNGIGISIQTWCRDEVDGQRCDATAPSSGTVRGSIIEQNHEVGVLVMGSESTIESSVVRGTLPLAHHPAFGRGVTVQMLCWDTPAGLACDPTVPSSAHIRGSLIDSNQDTGLLVYGSEVRVEASIVRDTSPRADDLLGDGIAVVASELGASATVEHSHVTRSARAGLAAFGSSVSLRATAIECSAFDLEGEVGAGLSFQLDDLGANACGCPPAAEGCQLVSVGLEPPLPQ
ncbi:MAG: right-handed parallel beta-helix repeat-containing protein [Deltaproteobacteria bacterium]|jgi:hypothetical protein|nr:right-handed parallel beta-helix repeat-containing protein [Deltaproteobacteria bacterium]MBW2532070.1 right-handed parallel beta-helix repeat-containing protein [Deltaproteobacteria bacterium]